MKSVIQRAKKANVKVEGKIIGSIEKGIVVFLGVAEGDTKQDANWLLNKIINLRIFPDEKGRMDKSLKDIDGSVLIVSQFTLLGNCRKGRRPSFDKAANPDKAMSFYDYFVEKAKETGLKVSSGKFKELMQVELVNDGPVTLIIDTQKS